MSCVVFKTNQRSLDNKDLAVLGKMLEANMDNLRLLFVDDNGKHRSLSSGDAISPENGGNRSPTSPTLVGVDLQSSEFRMTSECADRRVSGSSPVDTSACATGVCAVGSVPSQSAPLTKHHYQQLPANATRYKTELCRQFEENGTCRYGEKCQFAHGRAEIRSLARHPKYKTEMCRTFHTTGFCPYGLRCHFIHNEEERRLTAAAQPRAADGTPVTVGLQTASVVLPSNCMAPSSATVTSCRVNVDETRQCVFFHHQQSNGSTPAAAAAFLRSSPTSDDMQLTATTEHDVFHRRGRPILARTVADGSTELLTDVAMSSSSSLSSSSSWITIPSPLSLCTGSNSKLVFAFLVMSARWTRITCSIFT